MSDLIELADRIDTRLGPISGREADRLAVVLRSAAARITELEAALKSYLDWADPVECGAPDLKPIREQMRAALARVQP